MKLLNCIRALAYLEASAWADKLEKIKDLPLLYKLIDELKDAQNRTDSPTPATT